MAKNLTDGPAGSGHNSAADQTPNPIAREVLTQHMLLPWENEAEYGALLAAFVEEHDPQGPTETHLVEELAGIVWRKRRLRMAEGAAHRRGLSDAASPFKETVKAAIVHLREGDRIDRTIEAVRAAPETTVNELEDLQADEDRTAHALRILRSNQDDAYQTALAALHEDTRTWWHDELEGDEEYDEDNPYSADAGSLLQFIETEVCPWYETRRSELENRHLVRSQAFGESLDPVRLERLIRYEFHLDRKFERTLAMLLKLKELRRPGQSSPSLATV